MQESSGYLPLQTSSVRNSGRDNYGKLSWSTVCQVLISIYLVCCEDETFDFIRRLLCGLQFLVGFYYSIITSELYFERACLKQLLYQSILAYPLYILNKSKCMCKEPHDSCNHLKILLIVTKKRKRLKVVIRHKRKTNNKHKSKDKIKNCLLNVDDIV